MSSIREVPYIVVDVETTGSDPKNNRIIDIACILVNNGEIVSEYQSLVNPHQFIPPYIAQMTGIDNETAFKSPEAEFVMPYIRKFLSVENAVFVAHSVKFDWSFVSNSIEREGFGQIDMPLLCTLKLSRRLVSKDYKKNLGSLADYFGIKINNRHRAYGDAKATALILIELLELAEQEHGIETIYDLMRFQNRTIKKFRTPLKIYKKLESRLCEVPDEPGIYYFLNNKSQVIYIGKAKSLSSRVQSYFQESQLASEKIASLLRRIEYLDWIVTDSELSALLLESKEIKKHKPEFNIIDKTYKSFAFIRLTTGDDFPRLEICYEPSVAGSEYFGPFRSPFMVQNIIRNIESRFKLRKCTGNLNPSSDKSPCFYYFLGRCESPCSENINKERYAEEVSKVRYYLSSYSDGLVRQLESKMEQLSEEQKFEQAASLKNQIKELRRLFHRQNIPASSINDTNFILIVENKPGTGNLELFFIRFGKLAGKEKILSQTDLEISRQLLDKHYFTASIPETNLTPDEIDEIRIINSWANKKSSSVMYIPIDGKNCDSLAEELFSIISRLFSND